MPIKKLIGIFSLLFCSPWLWGIGGGANPLTVSSGTFQNVSMYSNDDGANRQAIILGNRTSSATANIDAITGMTVNLATSSLTGLTAINTYVQNPTTTTITGTPNVNISATAFPISTVTFNGVTQLVGASQTGTYTMTPGSGSFVITPGTGTFPSPQVGTYVMTPGSGSFVVTAGTGTFPINIAATAFQTSTVTFNGVTQPVNIAGTSFLTSTVTFNSVAQPVTASQTGTYTVTLGSGSFVVTSGTGSFPSPQVGTYVVTPGSGSFVVTAGTGTFPVNVAATAFQTSTVTFNGTAQPVTASQTGSYTVTAGSGSFVVTPGTGTYLEYQTNPATVTVLNSTAGVVGTLSHNGVAAATNRLPILAGIAQFAPGNNGAVLTQGRDVALLVLSTSGLLAVSNQPDITYNSYTGSTNTFTIANSTEDVTALCGNARNTVYLYSLRLSCSQTTAGNFNLSIVKRSTGYTGVWSTMTTTPQDSNYIVAGSTAIFITAQAVNNGTLVGYLDNYQIGCMAAATATPNDIYISPSDWKMKPIVLRGVSQCVGVNIQNATVTGNKFTATWSWMELNSP